MQVLARANRERLGALLGEVQRREGGDERYAASLRCARTSHPPIAAGCIVTDAMVMKAPNMH